MTETRRPRTGALMKWPFAAGLAAALICVLGAVLPASASARAQFYFSYLYAWLFWWSISTGAMALLMIDHLTGGLWGLMIRGIALAAMRTQAVLLVLFLPLLSGLRELYPWASGAPGGILLHKQAYLNIPFFCLRAVIYFTSWIGMSFFLSRWQIEGESQPRIEREAVLKGRLRSLSGGGLVLWGLTVTFSGIDWVMSLNARWYSTAFGMVYMVAQGLSALSFILVMLSFLARETGISERISRKGLLDLGSLLLMFTMAWSYLAFIEYLVTWDGNLPDEAGWFVIRSQGGWRWATGLLMALQFGIPFFLMLFRVVKRKARRLALVAALSLAIRWVDTYWLVMPEFHQDLRIHWLDLATPVAIGGFWFTAFLWYLRQRPVFPEADPHWSEVISHV